MQFESLANELILEVFEYLPAIRLVQAFHRLNSRLDDLLITHFQSYTFDFRTGSKEEFEHVCQNDLPLLVDQIASLGLSDDDENPHQLQLFLSQGWTLDRFSQLRSLSFDHLRASELVTGLLAECPHLVQLRLTGCYFGSSQSALTAFINTVWSLPDLIDCHLNIDVKHGFALPAPDGVSISMKQLTVIGIPFTMGRLAQLCDNTPNLQSLTLDMHAAHEHEFPAATTLPLVTSVNLVFVALAPGVLESFLRNLPNLARLKVETLYADIDGHEWAHMIHRYLPQLRTFELKMRVVMQNEQNRQEFFQSFTSPFWRENRRWPVQYHYNPDDASRMICLYTLPYAFRKMDMFFPTILQSTIPSDDHSIHSFDHLQQLGYRSALTDATVLCHLRFANLTSISIQLPIQTHLLSLIEHVTALRQVEVIRPKNMTNVDAQTQLQSVLDRAPHLDTLKFQSWKDLLQNNSRLTPMTLSSAYIRRIDLLGYDHYFTLPECERLSTRPLFSRCEVLSIRVMNLACIQRLTNTLPHLRSLIFRSNDDGTTNFRTIVDDVLVNKLQQLLPEKYSIARDARYVHHVRIWL